MNRNTADELDAIRSNINRLDAEIMESLKTRYAYSALVGEYKKANHLPVYDPGREQIVIAESASHFGPSMKDKIVSVVSSIMRVSRENQYDIIMDSDHGWEPGAMIDNAPEEIPADGRICCQGTSGSYSHLTAAAIYPAATIIPALTFEECLTKLSNDECDMTLLPLENTTAGTVNDVYDLLSESGFYIAQAISVPIRHRLVILPGGDVSRLTTVLSHPQALSQCSKYIRKAGLTPVPVANTAFAVMQLLEVDDPAYCAIASVEAGSINKLKVLDEDICDSVHNQTRFVVVVKKPFITRGANRISITFKTPHQSGALAYVLSAIAERGLSLTKIQSRPVPDKPWEYSFWADIAADRDDREARLVLYQLSRELPFLKFVGWYEDRLADIMTQPV
ncbi:MAG: bifunctional chorismate mutase/prephenate dehydratase [Saccharofermentanales bacterium]